MSINLSINFEHPDAVSNQVSYARIDNVLTPSFTTVSPNPVTSPATIATNVPNGQYQINSIPIYADGRFCEPTIRYTSSCPGLISITAVINSGNLVISYLAPSEVPKVRMTVNYPNGGSFVANYVNSGNNIVIPLPSGVTGNFTVSGQSVCDEDSGFYSPFSSQVVVSVTSDNVSIINGAAGITISVVDGINGFTLSSLVAPGNTVTGTHNAFYGGITCTFTGTPSVGSSATLSINGTIIQCVNVPNTNGGNLSFSAASFSSTDFIVISFSGGYCPTAFAADYSLGANEGAACAASPVILYSAFAFAPGIVLYTDSGLTANVTGFSIVSKAGILYNIDSSTGLVGAPTGNSC